jgi:carbon-monoxide dehydrogenase medium subunit
VTFDYHEPSSVDEVVALLHEHGDGAVLMAGGTVLAPELKSGRRQPRHVVALRRVGGPLCAIAVNGSLWLGSMATHDRLARSAAVHAHHPVIARTFAGIASVRIRNQGTIGGSVAAADSSYDPPPVLIAFDAVAHVVGPRGAVRQVKLDELFVDDRRTGLDQAELVVGIEVPAVAAGARASYLRFTPGSKEQAPTVTVAAMLRRHADGRISAARVAVGAVAPVVFRARAVEQALLGAHPARRLIAEAAALVGEEIEPVADGLGSARYKREMARVWVERALDTVARTDA